MKERNDLLEQVLKEEYERLAREEEKAVPEDIDMPDGIKEQLYAKIHSEIEEMETEAQSALLTDDEEEVLIKEDMDLYAMLSEEDRKALELGRKIMEDEVRKERENRVRKKKIRRQAYIGLAAALVLAMGIGVTTMGGPEKVIQMMTKMVGDREVVQVDSSEDNLSTEEKEEAAYEELHDYFGVDPVRISKRPENMYFLKIELDEENHVAAVEYEYNGQILFFLINSSYSDSSWGVDVEDKTIKKYEKEINNCVFEIREYEIEEMNVKKYSASFQYNKLAYFFVGEMEKEELEEILNFLFFPV